VGYGLHQAHDTSGNRLGWDGQAGKFSGGSAAYLTDAKENLEYKEATITIYEGKIEDDLASLQGKYGFKDSKATTEDIMVATFAHEADHDLNQKAIGALKRRQEGGKPFDVFKVVEKPAYKYTFGVLKEIRRNRK
jgi:hypothetical protein